MPDSWRPSPPASRHYGGRARARAVAPCAASARKYRRRTISWSANNPTATIRCRRRHRESVRRSCRLPQWSIGGRDRKPCRIPDRRPVPSAHKPLRPPCGRYLKPCPRPEILSAHDLDKRRLREGAARRDPGRRVLRGRTLDESAAEHARLARGRIVEYAGLAGRNAFFAGDEFDFITVVGRAQPSRLRRPCRSHAHENLETLADRTIERAVADPVDIAQHDAVHPQRLARAHHDTAAGGVEPHHIQRRAGGDAQSPPLAHGEMNDALMPADNPAVEVDDVAGLDGIRPQPADDVGITPGRHEADILAVLLVRHAQAETPRQFARLRLGHVAERKAQKIELLARGREQEIALVAIGIGGADQRPRSIAQAARGYIMSGRQRRGAEFARGLEQIAKLDRAVALDAWHRRLTRGVAV